MSRIDGLISKPAYAFRYNKAKKQIAMFKGNIFYNEKHAPGTKRPSIYFVCEGEKFTKYVFNCNEGEVDHYKLYIIDDGRSAYEIKQLAKSNFFIFYANQIEALKEKELKMAIERDNVIEAEFVERRIT